MVFAEWFKSRRKALGSQARLAYAIGTTERTLRSWESYGVIPGLQWAEAIAGALGESEDEVVRVLRAAHRANTCKCQDGAPGGEPGRKDSAGALSP